MTRIQLLSACCLTYSAALSWAQGSLPPCKAILTGSCAGCTSAELGFCSCPDSTCRTNDGTGVAYVACNLVDNIVEGENTIVIEGSLQACYVLVCCANQAGLFNCHPVTLSCGWRKCGESSAGVPDLFAVPASCDDSGTGA